ASTAPNLGLNLAGMPARALGVRIAIGSPNPAALGNLPVMGNTTMAPMVGDTTLTASTDWSRQTGPNLIDSTKGDSVYVTQLAVQGTAPARYLSLAKSYTRSMLTQIAAMASTLPATGSAAFTTPSAGGTIALNFHKSAFDALRPSVNPNALSALSLLAVQSAPAIMAHGPYAFPGPDLIRYVTGGPGGPGTMDVDFGSIAYISPFPTAWDVFGVGEWVYAVPYTLTGATPGQGPAFNVHVGSATSFGSAPVAPQLSPIRMPMVNGSANAFMNQTGIGTAPMLSWMAPATGTPTGYRINVLELVSAGGGTRAQSSGDIITKNTSIQLPPGLLMSGPTYVFRIQALMQGTLDPSLRPLRTALPFVRADALTGMMTPRPARRHRPRQS